MNLATGVVGLYFACLSSSEILRGLFMGVWTEKEHVVAAAVARKGKTPARHGRTTETSQG